MTRMLAATGLVAVLTGAASAQTPQQAQKAELLLREARVLKEAWVYLNAANADYAGHRARAMEELRQATVILDTGVLKNGTPNQKLTIKADDITAARLKFQREHAPKVTNPQQLSDLMVKQAGVMLVQVRPVFVTHKQPKVLGKVDDAIKQITLALKVN